MLKMSFSKAKLKRFNDVQGKFLEKILFYAKIKTKLC